MFCKYCGYEYQNDDAIFCPNCGKKLEEESIEVVNANSQSIEPEKPSVTYYNLGPLCMQYKFDSFHCSFGDPLTEKNFLRYQKVIELLNITNCNEQMYLVYLTSIATSMADGFAICSSGIYGCDTFRKIYINWDQFKTCTYKKCLLDTLKIDKCKFMLSSSNHVDTIIRLFDAIKASI